MDITAFEYQRKFHRLLELGVCPYRAVKRDLGNNTFRIDEERCTLKQIGETRHVPKEINYSKNVIIGAANDIVSNLGLCGGEAASFLGILYSGDCVAVEIASRLTFSEKTMVRAFIFHYRKSLDVFDSDPGNSWDGMDTYIKDKFYLENRSYGTLEIIIVQFRFRSKAETEKARALEIRSPLMSDYMRQLEVIVGIPRRVVVINLSTATQTTFEIRNYNTDEWERAVRLVEILELTIEITKESINRNDISPHLHYHLSPFMDTGKQTGRTVDRYEWEKISLLEVQLRQALNLAKKTAKKCRENKTKLCNRVRGLKRQLVSDQVEIHLGRTKWVNFTEEEKKVFADKFTTSVKMYSNVIKSLAKDVREMKKNEKMELLSKKQNRANQIPIETSNRTERRPQLQIHQFRFGRRV